MRPPETFPDLRIAPPDARGVLLWDGECGFCARAAAWFERHSGGRVGVRPVQEIAARLPERVLATAAAQMLWISGEGEVAGGSEAAIAALRASGHPLEAGTLRALQPLARWGYGLVAAHRGRVSRACGIR
jgi:predicted DCC family thiol-disulfide oxidoreductase YuxK